MGITLPLPAGSMIGKLDGDEATAGMPVSVTTAVRCGKYDVPGASIGNRLALKRPLESVISANGSSKGTGIPFTDVTGAMMRIFAAPSLKPASGTPLAFRNC